MPSSGVTNIKVSSLALQDGRISWNRLLVVTLDGTYSNKINEKKDSFDVFLQKWKMINENSINIDFLTIYRGIWYKNKPNNLFLNIIVSYTSVDSLKNRKILSFYQSVFSFVDHHIVNLLLICFISSYITSYLLSFLYSHGVYNLPWTHS
jgi:hypothetical protein